MMFTILRIWPLDRHAHTLGKVGAARCGAFAAYSFWAIPLFGVALLLTRLRTDLQVPGPIFDLSRRGTDAVALHVAHLSEDVHLQTVLVSGS